MADDPTAVLSVPSLPESMARVRHFAMAACRARGRSELCDTTALLVSEVATNAIVHGRGSVSVSVAVRADRLRVEVTDESPDQPQRRPEVRTDLADVARLPENGRGLALVDALSDAWGCTTHDPGKTVWFELAAGRR